MGPHSFSVLSVALALAGVARAALYTPPVYTTVYTPPAYTPSGYSSAYTPPPYTSTCTPVPFSPSYSDGYTSVYTPEPHTVVYTPTPYTPQGYSTPVTPTPYTVYYTPEPYTSSYTPPVAYTSVYTPEPYTSTYTPPPYTPSGSSSLYQPPVYTSVYTPPVYTSVYSPPYSPPAYTSVYSPTEYTTLYTPPPYTPPGSSSLYTPPAYTTVYTPPAYTTTYVPPVYSSSSIYTPPPSYTSSSVYTPPPSYTSSSDYTPPPSYTSSSVYTSPPSYTSSDYTPPVSYVPPPFTSVAYPTYEEPRPTSSYVPPTYTAGPGETSYAPETDIPTYTPPDPYSSATSVTIIGPSPTGNYTPVVGAPGVELRLPIDQLQSQYPDIWNMFCIGLEAMMAVDESIDISYYQISGIHGIPHIPWQYPVSASQDPSRGYCTHGSALFSTWHRPYLILLEQTIYSHAVAEAEKFTGPDAQKYKDAAKKVRVPYWDWASDSTKSHIPASVMAETLEVVKPAPGTGEPTPATIANPLFSYRFTRDDYRQTYFDEGFFRDTDSTRRQPDGNGVSRNALADQELANTYDSRRQNTFNLFSIPTFQAFSSNAWDGGSAPNAWTSVESIHNVIHGQTGGSLGHMSYVDYAAFDPIFWLHHCNVDRLTAMYQAVWPGNNVQPQAASGTFARRVTEGDIDDINTPLYPFRHTNGAEWTSKDVSDAQSVYRYGYAYPEIPLEYQGRSDEELRVFAIGKVNELYQPPLQEAVPAPSGGTIRREWVAHIAFDQADIPGDFNAKVFTGDVPQDVKDWSTAADLIGECATFGGASTTMHHVIKGTVPLTQALLDKGIGLDPEAAVPYLKENCHWVIQQGGYSVPLSEVRSLKVGVSSTEVQYFDDKTQLAKWGQAYTHYEITDGRQGGLQANETHLVQSADAPPVINGTEPYSNTTTTRLTLRVRSRPFRL